MNRSIYIPVEFVPPHCSNASLSFLVDIANIFVAVLTEVFMWGFFNMNMREFTLAFSDTRFPPNPPAPTKNKEN